MWLEWLGNVPKDGSRNNSRIYENYDDWICVKFVALLQSASYPWKFREMLIFGLFEDFLTPNFCKNNAKEMRVLEKLLLIILLSSYNMLLARQSTKCATLFWRTENENFSPLYQILSPLFTIANIKDLKNT